MRSKFMNPDVGFPKSETEKKDSPFIRRFFKSPLSGEEIEARSMKMIEKEAPPHSFNPEEWQVVRRMIHTTGDFGLIPAVRFSPGAIHIAIQALQSCRPIYVDSRMIQSGLSLPRLRSVHGGYNASHFFCYVDDEEVVEKAQQMRLPRSLFAIRKAKPMLHGGLAVFGNSPIALLELNRLILEEQIRPALVVAMPVGFVHVVESKEELMSLNVPYIAISGRRGGSPLAVSVVHALCSIATNIEKGIPKVPDQLMNRDAILLLGHGSRIPGASKDMETVVTRMKEKYGYQKVEIGFMSGLGPHLSEVIGRFMDQGAKRVIVIPYFLHLGAHLLQDIPKMIQTETQKFPQIQLILGRGLGFDESLVDLVHRNIQETKRAKG
jgi:precorrin isomerase